MYPSAIVISVGFLSSCSDFIGSISFGVTFSLLVNFSSGFSLIAFTVFPFSGIVGQYMRWK